MKNSVLLYLEFIKMKFASRIAYRLDFFASIIAFFLYQLIGPIFVGVVYYSGGKFEGWTIYELLLLQGVATIIQGFSFLVVFSLLWTTRRYMREGTLDLLLIRPINTLWLMVMNAFDEEDVAQVAGGLAIFFFAVYHLDKIEGSWILFALLFILGFLFFFSFALLCSAATMKFIETMRLWEFIDMMIVLAHYPRNAYSKSVGLLFSTIIPLLIAGHYPASVLMGRTLDGIQITIVSTIGLFAFSLFIWHKTLKSYTSAGG